MANPFRVFKKDVGYFLKNRMLIITFLGVSLVPMLYGGFLIKGNWDPYGQLQDLPVAVVNLDKGAEYQGKSMNVGEDFVNELKENETFDWQFVNENAAKEGMVSNRYYATITIPEEFSEHAASLTSETPQKADIIFESNSFYNFISGQISENATKELRNKLSQNLTEAYSRSMLSQFSTLSSGLSRLAAGASDLHSGAVQLEDGAGTLNTKLQELSSGAAKLHSSIGQLEEGAAQLNAGLTKLSSSAGTLSSGASQLGAASTQLQEGADKLADGSTQLKTGIQSAKNGADELYAGMQQTAAGSKQLETGLTASSSASDTLADGSAQVAAGLQQLADGNAELASDPAVQKLLAASQAVASGAKELSKGQQQLLAGSRTLNAGQQKLLAGGKQLSAGQSKLLQSASQLATAQNQLHDGITQVFSKFPALVSGSKQLGEGASQLAQGAGKLKGGIAQFESGGAALASGASQLAAGAGELREGAGKLASGSQQLADSLADAAEQTASLKADEKTIQMIAEPVTIVANDDRKVRLYANGIAPYFLSMALFAGSLVFTTMFSARQSSSAQGADGLPLFLSKLLTFGLMSLAQSLILSTVVLYVLGLKVQNVPLFYLYTMMTGFAFMFVVQAFVTWLDNPGRFVVLLLMIFQLVSSAGTFPYELLPGWAQAMNPWLPMTYSIRGYRDVISSGDFGHMWAQIGHLVIYVVIFIILTGLYFVATRKKSKEEQLIPVKI
ncbi:YhgE/Pip domain-containing protein [Paenibacillus glycanilyticus]|uniref:YhgE/Pip family protein n=1 Tax=Paenibacillus glycanilyticus TaxID=126569 RepID=UPI00204151C8|nr:YhgE/Pip domain-containing protein [Paenibacillus glycanilyticus]MCM3627842.1 YhgE/Pip domain-containing protein [Paenibacillus glycanilyticus]